MMPLNTSLLPPPVEADFNALFAFDDKELVIDPNEEIVSGSFFYLEFKLKYILKYFRRRANPKETTWS